MSNNDSCTQGGGADQHPTTASFYSNADYINNVHYVAQGGEFTTNGGGPAHCPINVPHGQPAVDTNSFIDSPQVRVSGINTGNSGGSGQHQTNVPPADNTNIYQYSAVGRGYGPNTRATSISVKVG